MHIIFMNSGTYIKGFLLKSKGVFIARGKEDALVTKNMAPGDAVYGEKRISVEVRTMY